MIDEQELEALKQQQQQLEIQERQLGSQHANQDLMAQQLREQERSYFKEQINLTDELETIEHLLRGEILKYNEETGVQDWARPVDSEMIILTEHGVHLIMNTIMFYLNKNTLLSNYEDKVINQKMEDFATALADVIFMEYEKVFMYPTFEECKAKLEERIERKTELREFAYTLAGKKANKEEIKQGFVEEIEERIEREINNIREQIIKNKLKRFEIIIREVQDAVHSTYLRAWNGQERRTLRQHIHVSEVMGSGNQPPIKQKRNMSLNPFSMFRR